MDIQSNIASSSAFDGLGQNKATGQSGAPRTDMFSSLMDRLLSESAARRREQEQEAAGAAERKAPVRAEPPKPRHAPQAAAPKPQAPRKDEPPRAENQTAAKADATDSQASRTAETAERKDAEKAEHADRKDQNAETKDAGAKEAGAARDAKAAQTKGASRKESEAKGAKDAKAKETKATDDAAAADTDDASADGQDGAIDAAATDGQTDATASATTDEEPAEDSDDGDIVEIDVDVTITETVIEVVGPDATRKLTDVQATLSLGVSAGSDTTDQTDTTTGDPTAEDGVAPVDAAQPGKATDPAAQLAVQLAAAQNGAQTAATQAAGKDGVQAMPGQPPTADSADPAARKGAEHAGKPGGLKAGDAKPGERVADGLPSGEGIKPEDLKAAMNKAAEAKTAEAKPAEGGDGSAKGADLPTDDDVALPQNLADLAAAKAKGVEKAGHKGDADAGTKGDGQNPANTPMPTPQPQAPQTQAADSVKSAAENAFLAATSGAAKTAATEATDAAKPAESVSASNPISTHPALAAMEAPHAANGVDAPPALAHLRPSRGSAGLPMGVQEQVAVHVQKNVSDGNDQFTINLRPVEMGQIDIRLEIGPDGQVNAHVAVEKAQTLELLQRDSRNLERALQDAGLKADSNSLNFSLRGEGGNPFQDEGRQGGSGRRGRGLAGGGGEVEDAQAAYTMTLAPGRVDIQA
ncbi:flagellar hook-length control protein FliK [Azospirillum sp. sgz302134]